MSELTNTELAVLSFVPFVIGFAVANILQSIRNHRPTHRPVIRPQPARQWAVVQQQKRANWLN